MNARYGYFLVAKKVILTKIAFLWKASENLPIIRITKANSIHAYEEGFAQASSIHATKKVLLKQNSANAYEDSFAKAKL
ncbi:hypothetical protein D3C73_1060020 [compost metagenome]